MELDEHFEVGPAFVGTTLFIDVRKSTKIVDFVEQHHGPQAAATLFMRFLVGTMAAVDGPTVYRSGPSGDAVLTIFNGDTRKSDAIDAARRALAFVRYDFMKENRQYLTCTGQCGQRECPVVEFHVGAGLDDGQMTVSRLSVGQHESRELVGGCVSFAAKLSGAAPLDGIVVSAVMAHDEPELVGKYRGMWSSVEVGNTCSTVVLIDSPV
jgi:class 3 adenylate cyclase